MLVDISLMWRFKWYDNNTFTACRFLVGLATAAVYVITDMLNVGVRTTLAKAVRLGIKDSKRLVSEISCILAALHTRIIFSAGV